MRIIVASCISAAGTAVSSLATGVWLGAEKHGKQVLRFRRTYDERTRI